MGLRKWLGLGWGGAVSGERAREADEGEDDGWRRAALLGGRSPDPERDELDGERLLREVYKAYRENPLAYAIVEQQTSFVLGGGAKVVANDSRVQRVVDRFWSDAENRMALRVYSIQTELSLFGEQFIRFFTDEVTGRVIVRQLDPLYVKEIRTDAEDLEKAVAYRWAPPRGLLDAGSLLGDGEWVPAAEVLHVAVNKVSSGLRGRSDLAPVLPYLRRYREWLDDRIIQNKLKGAVVWDVAVAGAGRAEINRLRAQWPVAPDRGTVLFHNENEKWQPVKAQIDAGDASADGRAIRLMVAVGALLPEHYLAEGGNANRATAAEMGLPAIKRFQRRQEVLRAALSAIVERVIEEGVKAGRLGPRVDRGFLVQFEELTTSPLEAVAGAVERLTRGLVAASREGWVSQEEARRLWWRYAAQADESVPQGDGGLA